MSPKNLEEVLKKNAGNTVDMLRNSQIGAYVYPVVPPEFSNWRDEQRAWREAGVLYDQSHHMAELTVKGPDAQALLTSLAINSFANFDVTKAKHFVPCSYDGYVRDEGLQRVATRRQLRSVWLDWRVFRLQQHRGLLPDSSRTGLRVLRQV